MDYKLYCLEKICVFILFIIPLQVLALHPAINAILERVNLFISQKNYLAAKQLLNEAKQKVGNIAEIQKLDDEINKLISEEVSKRLSLANFYKQYQPPKALEIYYEILQFDPNNKVAQEEIKNIKKIIQLREKYKEQGIYIPDSHKNAYNPNTLSAHDYFNRALIAFKKDMLEIALDYALKAVELDNTFKEAKDLLKQIQERKKIKDLLFEAYNYEQINEYKKIYEIYNELSQKEPLNLYYILMKSLAANMLKKFDEALNGLKKVLISYDDFIKQIDSPTENSPNKAYYTLRSKLSKKFILENIAKAYEGLGMYQHAAAIVASYNQYSKKFVSLYFRSHSFLTIIWFLLILILFLLIFKLVSELDKLFVVLPLKLLWYFIIMNLTIIIKGNYKNLLSRIYTLLNIYKLPLLAYLAGLLYILENDYNKSLFCFQQSLSSKYLESKSYFFLALIRIYLKSDLAINNLENAILSALKHGYPSMPWYLLNLENSAKDKLIRAIENKLTSNDRCLLESNLALFYIC